MGVGVLSGTYPFIFEIIVIGFVNECHKEIFTSIEILMAKLKSQENKT